MKIFADGADETGLLEMYAELHPRPRRHPRRSWPKPGSGIAVFARDILATITDQHLSLAVLPTSSTRWSARRFGSPAGVTTSM